MEEAEGLCDRLGIFVDGQLRSELLLLLLLLLHPFLPSNCCLSAPPLSCLPLLPLPLLPLPVSRLPPLPLPVHRQPQGAHVAVRRILRALCDLRSRNGEGGE
eukprot:756181-Hanusia_phi.AAC.1